MDLIGTPDQFRRPTGGPGKIAERTVLATLAGAVVGASTFWLLAAGVPASLITGVTIGLGVASTLVAAAKKYGPTSVNAVDFPDTLLQVIS